MPLVAGDGDGACGLAGNRAAAEQPCTETECSVGTFTQRIRHFLYIFTVNRSTFVNKKSREQFELSSYKRLIDIYSSTAKTVDALMKLELPSGVEVEIKV